MLKTARIQPEEVNILMKAATNEKESDIWLCWWVIRTF